MFVSYCILFVVQSVDWLQRLQRFAQKKKDVSQFWKQMGEPVYQTRGTAFVQPDSEFLDKLLHLVATDCAQILPPFNSLNHTAAPKLQISHGLAPVSIHIKLHWIAQLTYESPNFSIGFKSATKRFVVL